jgi:hypothetical protein
MKNILKLSLGLFFVLILSCSSGGDGAVPSISDTEAPSIPTNLKYSSVNESSVSLNWTASTDNSSVQSYLIFKNNENLFSTNSTTYLVTNLDSNTEYTFKVQAKDKAGNISSYSNPVSVTTAAINSELQYGSGSIETYLGNIIDNDFPGSSGDNYKEPNDSEIAIWELVIKAILDKNISVAVQKSALLKYQIKEFTDNLLSPQQTFIILEKKSSQSNYWGTYVFSKTPTREHLVISAPHVKYDTNSGKQSAYCFRNNLAKALFINGTHRCNNEIPTSCSGTTTACSPTSEAYRISDMAHNVRSVFQKTTEILATSLPSTIFVQLHGFDQNPSDPSVIMSNGTRETPTVDYASLIKGALLSEDNSLTFKIAHIDKDWTKLIGLTNTQGRYINNSPNPCSTTATSTTGRFIHIEQERLKLRADIAGWKKMSNALKSVFQ